MSKTEKETICSYPYTNSKCDNCKNSYMLEDEMGVEKSHWE